jgi:hypothetical protein
MITKQVSQNRFVFVGQGPNRAAWERGLALGRAMPVDHRAFVDGETFEQLVLDRAERYCERIALTGAAGTKIGGLLGISVGEFFRAYERRNLNARFNGKEGKGDNFNRDEGRAAAAAILDDVEDFDRIVCVGAEVAGCFGIGRIEPLGVRGKYIPAPRLPKRERWVEFFLLPHPSGIVQWWNEPFNRSRAQSRLREFLQIRTIA